MNLIKKVPWGTIAGLFGVLLFYTLTGTIVAGIVMNSITAIVEGAAGIFGTWWQTLLFVGDIIFGIVFIGSLVMFILIKAGVFGVKEGRSNA